MIPQDKNDPSRERKRAVGPASGNQQARTLAVPLAYLITFTCYGTWLHGDESGSVDRRHNTPFSPVLPDNTRRRESERERMRQPPYELDESGRQIVLAALCEACAHRSWPLLAAHVRTHHVHLVIHSFDAPEKVMRDLKAHASRRLSEVRHGTRDRRRWTRHGSTRYLWQPHDVEGAIWYVISEQGEPMAVFEHPDHSLTLAAPIESGPRRSQSDRQVK